MLNILKIDNTNNHYNKININRNNNNNNNNNNTNNIHNNCSEKNYENNFLTNNKQNNYEKFDDYQQQQKQQQQQQQQESLLQQREQQQQHQQQKEYKLFVQLSSSERLLNNNKIMKGATDHHPHYHQQQHQKHQQQMLQDHLMQEAKQELQDVLGKMTKDLCNDHHENNNLKKNFAKNFQQQFNENNNNKNKNNNINVNFNFNNNDDEFENDFNDVGLKQNCDKSATPSLQQEMNLARRACWCNNEINPKNQNYLEKQLLNDNKINHNNFNINNNNTVCNKCHCDYSKFNENYVKNYQKDETITTTSSSNSIINDDEQDADNEEEDDNDDVNENLNETKNKDQVHRSDNLIKKLNGATNSSSINLLNSNTNTNNNDTTITANENLKQNRFPIRNSFNSNYSDAETKSKAQANINNNNEYIKGSDLFDTKTEKSVPSTRPLLTSYESNDNTSTNNVNNIKDINKISDENPANRNLRNRKGIQDNHHSKTKSNSSSMESCSFMTILKMKLLAFWLAFVKFCDANTIKLDDPRFAEAIRREKEEDQKRKEEDKLKKSKPYKIITSKKFIFLVIVTMFFSRLNRIEARPNMSVSQNAILGQESDAPNTIPNDLAASILQASNGGDTSPKLSVQLDDVPSLKPPATNAIPNLNPIDNNNDIHHQVPYDLPHMGPPHLDAKHASHKHDRYPLSQVDFDRVKTPFIIGIWILSASIAKIGFHMTPKLHLIFPESCLLIVVGVVIGVVLYFCTDVAVSPLTPETFFFYMLPPIILDAGYFMPNRLFFDNLGTILLMAVVGTIFNIATIGGSLYACGLTGIFGVGDTPKLLDTFLFASLISAVDPVAVLAVFEEIHVNEILYIVVFGESLLNDAVTVVMYHMMEVYNEIGISKIIAQDVASGVGSFFVVAIGGTVIGIIWGFLTGLVTRFTDHVRVIEPIFIFVMAYLAYLNAEIFHMSGILAITFCGITMKNYVESNISQKSHTTVKYALKMLSSSSETIIFMFLGVATVNNNHVWNTWFVLLTILFCSVFRPIGVIILTAIANRFRLHKLSRVDQFVMSYGGLRGAVAFALVLLIDEHVIQQKNMFITTTIAVIYFTVFLQGITIKPLVKILNVKRANKRKPTMNERIHERFMDHLMAGIEDIVGKTGNYNVRDKFKHFDNRFIRPLLIRDLKGAEPKIIETYSKLTMRDAIEVMRRNPSTIGQMTGTESMSALFRTYTNNCIGGSPSLTNLDNTCSRNLDMHELDYNPSKKDLTDAKIHHLLAEELKPYRRHRRLSYSRHAVDDRDLSTQVNYKMQMNFRRMFNDRKHHKRSKRGQKEGVKTNHVSFHDFQQNGTTKQFSHEENLPKQAESAANDDWDDGLTFTAKSSLAENPIPEEDRNLSRDSDGERRVATPTATESQLPWKRQGDEVSDAIQQNEFPAWASNKEYLAYNSPSATFLGGINKPKQPKSVIGLFRRESSSSKGGGSLTGVDTQMDAVSVRGSDPALAAALSIMLAPSMSNAPNPRLDKRSQSVSAGSGPSINVEGHAGPFPVTASHRRNVRRGSMLELSGDTIPEETYYHGHSKSLCEPTGDEWETTPLASSSDHNTSTNSEKHLRASGREPLLPKLTPRAQIRRGMNASAPSSSMYGGMVVNRNPVTAALLSNTSDYDDDEEEDFDLYADENIVVTTTTNDSSSSSKLDRNRTQANSTNASAASGQQQQPSTSGGNSTVTTIRLTQKNDESII